MIKGIQEAVVRNVSTEQRSRNSVCLPTGEIKAVDAFFLLYSICPPEVRFICSFCLGKKVIYVKFR